MLEFWLVVLLGLPNSSPVGIYFQLECPLVTALLVGVFLSPFVLCSCCEGSPGFGRGRKYFGISIVSERFG